ncbi:DUF4391 domain-containing protein [Arachnia propionica]|uniref:DUF4391 domain-containing protein n=1 Tax=Arachnia propionica TaxID=1750 RepID=A0A3P1TDI4_9ACTN|nr:DUF4391 domain-containing protein [Arachnia propionica]RRD06563.1 DUF4391 domain-containing protein [Arachnia propionica]
MVELLHQWPAAARVGTRVAKEKIQTHGPGGTSMRQRLVTEVERITWAYKLAEVTVNLEGSPEVPEIQVFVVEAKGEDVSDEVLAAMDKAVKFPIVFEVVRHREGAAEVRMVAALKQLDGGRPRLSAYHSTRWLPVDAPRQPMPTAITLPLLYTALLAPLTSVSIRPGEEMSQLADRLDAVRRLEREVSTLERRMRQERQFNRKVELRRRLKATQHELEQQR